MLVLLLIDFAACALLVLLDWRRRRAWAVAERLEHRLGSARRAMDCLVFDALRMVPSTEWVEHHFPAGAVVEHGGSRWVITGHRGPWLLSAVGNATHTMHPHHVRLVRPSAPPAASSGGDHGPV